jgi:hypothetical protein
VGLAWRNADDDDDVAGVVSCRVVSCRVVSCRVSSCRCCRSCPRKSRWPASATISRGYPTTPPPLDVSPARTNSTMRSSCSVL